MIGTRRHHALSFIILSYYQLLLSGTHNRKPTQAFQRPSLDNAIHALHGAMNKMITFGLVAGLNFGGALVYRRDSKR